jgi:hypothetical protein
MKPESNSLAKSFGCRLRLPSSGFCIERRFFCMKMERISQALQISIVVKWSGPLSVKLSFFTSSISSLLALPLRELSLVYSVSDIPLPTRHTRRMAQVCHWPSRKIFGVYERLGVIMPPHDKDPALLPRKINGFWALIHRPMTPLGAHIWISYSPDLRHWGNHKLMLEARRGAWWDANKIGMSPPPIETSIGWLMIYHGVRRTPSSSIENWGVFPRFSLAPANRDQNILLTVNRSFGEELSAGIALSSATVGVNSQCQFSVTVTGVVPGNYTNTTSSVAPRNRGQRCRHKSDGRMEFS